VHFKWYFVRVRRGLDRLVVRFTTTCVIIAYHHWSCEFEPSSWRGVLDKHYVIKFVSDLRQIGGFLRVIWFPPPIKLIWPPHYNWNFVESGAKHYKPTTNQSIIYFKLYIFYFIMYFKINTGFNTKTENSILVHKTTLKIAKV
jgi:hypothetical protein